MTASHPSGPAGPGTTAPPAAVLLSSQLVFNLGFYAVVPFLAVVMRDDLGLGALAIGLVLGARTFSQQGLFLLGGMLADRFGPRTLIAAGCVVRVSGYLGLALAAGLPGFLVGAILTGLGGALFSPALQSLVAAADARSRPTRRPGRPSLFAALVLVGEIGAAVGPLAGAALLGLGFSATVLVGAALFAAVGAALWCVIPADAGRAVAASRGEPRAGSEPVGGAAAVPAASADRWAAVRDRRFLAFSALFAVDLVAYNQLYLGLPLELARAGAGNAAVGSAFLAVSLLTIALQWPAALLAKRLGPGRALALGFGTTATGFAALALASVAPPAAGAALVPAAVLVVCLTLGHMTAGPVTMELVPSFAAGRPTASFYGLLASCGGVAVLVAGGVVGSLLDAWPAVAWGILAVLPVAAAVGLPRLLPGPIPSHDAHDAHAAGRAASALALSGCFAAGPGSATGGGQDGDARIRLAMLQPPRSGLTPLSDDAFKLARWSTAETLVTLDDLGDAQPLLATGWTRVDDLTWAFDIRPDVPFHDGTTLTAAQAAASLTAAATASPKPRILDGVDLTATADGDRVLVRTATPDPLVPQRMSSPQLAILAASAYGADGTVSPVGTGTGPFRLTAVDGTSSATLDRFDGYWGGRAASAGIDVRFVPDGTARAAALRTGTADVVEAIPVGQAAQVDPQLLHEVAMPRTNTLYLNTRTGPFADPAVRAAAEAAVDRAALVSGVYEGRADAATGLLGPALPWAADLRDGASYRDALAGRATPAQVDGVPITLGTFTDRAELPEVAVQLEQQLEAAGFDVTQDVREYQYIEADALAGRFDAFILSRATVLDSGDPAAYLYSDFACQGSFNISQECDPAVDQALAEASALPAGPERRAAIMRVEALVLADDAAVPLLHERVIQGEAAGVTGAVRDPRERALITVDTRVER